MVVLNDEYYVVADSLNYTLKRKGVGRSKKTNEPIETNVIVGYYGNFTECIKSAIKDTKLRQVERNDYTLEETLQMFKEVDASFEEILKKAIEEV